MEWHRGHTIGHGSSATVSLAICRAGIFAVKSSELSNSEYLQREQRILSSLCSPYVVTYKGCDITMETKKQLYNLFMEYMPFGNLVQETRRRGGRLDEPAIVYYTRQVLKGLEYLHSNGVVHCDIKGTNILIGEDGAKIGDLGCAKRVNDTAAAAPIGGTPVFMAPEVARGEEQECASDIWSFGCTLIEMATGFSPWPNVDDPFSVLYHVAHSNKLPDIPCFLSEKAKDFLMKCFRRNPNERWTASQLLKHPFLDEESCSNNNNQVLESNSSSPTSILDQCFWSSIEESQSLGNLIVENSHTDRIRKLAAISGEPCWAWHHDDNDENWTTVRGNETIAEVEDFNNCGSEIASTSEVAQQELVKSNVDHFCQVHKCRDSSVVISNLNFERGIITEMLLPSALDFL